MGRDIPLLIHELEYIKDTVVVTMAVVEKISTDEDGLKKTKQRVTKN